MKQSKLFYVILSVVLILSLFAGCGTTNAELPSGRETVSSDSDNTATSAISDDLADLDKFTVEHAARWLRTVMPELSEPQAYYLNDGSLSSWSLSAGPLYVDIFPADSGVCVEKIFISFLNPDWASDEHVKQLKDLSVAVAEHYLTPDVSSHVASVLDIGPIANESYRYGAIDRFETRYPVAGKCEVECRIDNYNYLQTVFYVSLDMATGRPTYVGILPDIPTADPDLQACQEHINSELTQAGYPVNVHFYEDRYAVVYTGSDEDIYTNYISLGNINGQIFASTVPGASEEAQNVVRIIGRIIAQYGENSFSAEFMEAFFDLWSVTDLYTEGQFVNQYGAKLIMHSYGINAVEYYSDNRVVCYNQRLDGECEFIYESKSSTPETTEPTYEPKYAKHILISDYIPQFTEKFPEGWDAFQFEGEKIVRIFDPESGAPLFQVHFHFRPDDNVIERISVSCDAAYASDARIDRLFREVTAAVVELCDIGFTADDVLGMYEEPFVNENGIKSGGLYGDGIAIDYMYHKDGVSFSMQFALEDLSEGQPEDPSEDQSDDLSSAENVLDGPAVVDGRFKWISDIALEDLPDELYVWFEEYFSTVDLSLRLSSESGIGQAEDGDSFTRSGFCLGIDVDLDETQYGLITVLDDNPHFIMGYNEDLSAIMGLEDGIYYYGASPEVIRQFPVCLSLMCDDGMTVSEAKELFSHSWESTKILDGMEVMFYCPREVAHILIYDPQTDACVYTAMTKADFEATHGGSLDAFIQNYS